MKRLLLFIMLCFMLCLYVKNASGTFLDHLIHDPDAHRNLSELITSKGYPVEEHTVQTADGYLLSLIRIPYGRNNYTENREKSVVLFIHGIVSDAIDWVINFPGQSLGFVLPDKGYDVWLLNTRGVRYSRKHVLYKTHQNQFWNFSFDQVAQYDVPNTIDYILSATGDEDLYIIGHSQGATATFAMLSELPNYNDKVKLFIALAPVTSVGYVTTAPRVLAPFANEIRFAVEILFAGEISPDIILRVIREQICSIFPELCEVFLFSVAGYDKQQLNETRLGVYAAQYLSPTSAKSLVHFAQLVKSKRFRKYDYLKRLNLEYYHQETPPEYDLSSITTPVALIWSSNDKLADAKDVDILRRKLASLVFDYQVPYPYNHADFLIALNTPQLINQPVLKLLAHY